MNYTHSSIGFYLDILFSLFLVAAWLLSSIGSKIGLGAL